MWMRVGCLTLLQSQVLSVFPEIFGANEVAQLQGSSREIKSHRGLQWSLGWNCNWKMQWAVQHRADAWWDKARRITPFQVQTSSPTASLQQITQQIPKLFPSFSCTPSLISCTSSKIISWKHLQPKKQKAVHTGYLQRKEDTRYGVWVMLLPRLVFVVFVLLSVVLVKRFHFLNISQWLFQIPEWKWGRCSGQCDSLRYKPSRPLRENLRRCVESKALYPSVNMTHCLLDSSYHRYYCKCKSISTVLNVNLSAWEC